MIEWRNNGMNENQWQQQLPLPGHQHAEENSKGFKQTKDYITVLPPEFHVQLPSLPLYLNRYKLKLIISQKSLLPVHLFSVSSL